MYVTYQYKYRHKPGITRSQLNSPILLCSESNGFSEPTILELEWGKILPCQPVHGGRFEGAQVELWQQETNKKLRSSWKQEYRCVSKYKYQCLIIKYQKSIGLPNTSEIQPKKQESTFQTFEQLDLYIYIYNAIFSDFLRLSTWISWEWSYINLPSFQGKYQQIHGKMDFSAWMFLMPSWQLYPIVG